jgi:hypothetical protein
MAAKSFCLFIRETAFNTPITTLDNTTVDTGWVPLDLPDDDAVAIRRTPNVEQLMTAKARGGPDRVVGDSYGIGGQARGILYPNQAPLLVGWGCQLVDQTASPDQPWTTTELDGDMASATFALAYEDWSRTYIKRRYRGCKAASFSLEAARGTRGGVVQWSAEVVGSNEASSTDTEPALSLYPTLAAYHISDAALTVNNVAISNFEGFNLTVANTYEVAFDEGATAGAIRLQSRMVTLAIPGAALKATPDWEALYTGQTIMAATTLVLTHPGNNHRITLNLQGAARMNEWGRNLRLQQRHNQSCTITAQLDRSTGGDFTVSFTDPTP